MKRMKPTFEHPEAFHAEVTDRQVRSFLFLRDVYRVRIGEGFALQDSRGRRLRPVTKEYDSDAASIPHPLDWLIPAFNVLRYKRSSMGIHDPACGEGSLELWDEEHQAWKVIFVTRKQADALLAEALEAEGAWRATRWSYWAGVRAGAGGKAVKDTVLDWRNDR
jgi:hypothetical protein